MHWHVVAALLRLAPNKTKQLTRLAWQQRGFRLESQIERAIDRYRAEYAKTTDNDIEINRFLLP